MDTVRHARPDLFDPALHRQPDDHAAAHPPLPPEISPAETADLTRLADWLALGEGAPVDPARLVQSGPVEHPLVMPVQDLAPAWFSSLLEILGFASWQRTSERAMIRGDA